MVVQKQDMWVEYARLTAQKKDLEGRINALKVDILSEMTEAKVTKIKTDVGNFTKACKTTWKYTDKVKTLEDKLKVEKIKEQEKGDATANLTEYLVFKGI